MIGLAKPRVVSNSIRYTVSHCNHDECNTFLRLFACSFASNRFNDLIAHFGYSFGAGNVFADLINQHQHSNNKQDC
jgi:hypothetical protein